MQDNDMNSNHNNFADTVSVSGKSMFNMTADVNSNRASLKKNSGSDSINQNNDHNGNANQIHNHVMAPKHGNALTRILFAVGNLVTKIFRGLGHQRVKQLNDYNKQRDSYKHTLVLQQKKRVQTMLPNWISKKMLSRK